MKVEHILYAALVVVSSALIFSSVGVLHLRRELADQAEQASLVAVKADACDMVLLRCQAYTALVELELQVSESRCK